MKNLKKLTILHSNDLHGDFLAEEVDKTLVGGRIPPLRLRQQGAQ